MTEQEIRNIVLDELQRVGILLDDDEYFPVTPSPDNSSLLPFMSADGTSYGRVPLSNIGGGDALVSVVWTGGSINPSTVRPNGTSTLTKGTVTATYQSGRTEDVTTSAVFLANNGLISGTIYTAPISTGSDTISVSYGGITASSTITVTVEGEPVVKKPVKVGHGTDYADAQSNEFGNTGSPLTNNMIVTIANDAGDYLFIKVDKTDTLNNLYTYPGPNMSSFEYNIGLVYGGEDGDYKYYRTDITIKAGTRQYKLNRV